MWWEICPNIRKPQNRPWKNYHLTRDLLQKKPTLMGGKRGIGTQNSSMLSTKQNSKTLVNLKS